jgi:stage V sporulation protein SpoVS
LFATQGRQGARRLAIVTDIDYWGVAEALRARGHQANVMGGGGAPPLVSVTIARGRYTTWDGYDDAWCAQFVEADGDQAIDEALEITSVSAASAPTEVADAISAALRDRRC